MGDYRCVKCGDVVEVTSAGWRKDRDCGPACDNCRNAVTEETMKRYSMWPSHFYGGWLWDKGQWWPVHVPEHRKQV